MNNKGSIQGKTEFPKIIVGRFSRRQ